MLIFVPNEIITKGQIGANFHTFQIADLSSTGESSCMLIV